MYDFYPPISAYLIPLLSLSWPKRCMITLCIVGSFMSMWYAIVYRQLIAQYNYQRVMLEKTNQEYLHLPELKKQIAQLEKINSEIPKQQKTKNSSTGLLSLCSMFNLAIQEYDNQSASLPGMITLRGRFDDQYLLLQKLQDGAVDCTYSACRVERIDDDTVAMTLSFNEVR
jgi:hypothetical protein